MKPSVFAAAGVGIFYVNIMDGEAVFNQQKKGGKMCGM